VPAAKSILYHLLRNRQLARAAPVSSQCVSAAPLRSLWAMGLSTGTPPHCRRLGNLARSLRLPRSLGSAAEAEAEPEPTIFINPRWVEVEAEFSQTSHAGVISTSDVAAARAEVSAWTGYNPTPLIDLPQLAQRLGVSSLRCKHEGHRFDPVGSFKPTGVVYALARILLAEVGQPAPIPGSSAADQLLAGDYSEQLAGVTVCAATSGNHGRALAFGARLFGCRCKIYMGTGVSASRQAAIESLGATVERVPGSYDDVVAKSEADAAQHKYYVISNVAYPNVDVPNLIMHGYALAGDEIATQLTQSGDPPPTHVFVCGGGGRFGAGVAAALWQRYGAARPKCVIVEPLASAALQASAKAGSPTTVKPGSSVMDGLVVESASTIGYPVLHDAAFAFLAVPDDAARDAMRMLAEPESEQSLVVGETGIAGWAGFISTLSKPNARACLRVHRASSNPGR
jgi:diaminopropionate ammonia-lyase